MAKIIFFGSGPVAVASLVGIRKDFEIEAIITKPSTLHDITEVAPKTLVLTANNKKELEEVMTAQNLKSRVGVLVDYGVIISKKVIDMFEFGIVNSHFSLLPEWRGADPIAFAILSGQSKTGVSLMIIDEGLDTGKIITQKNLPVSPNATTDSLTSKLINLSNGLLKDTLPKYLAGKIRPRSQPHPDRATYSRKLAKHDGIIDWAKPAKQIEREIRAYQPWPKSRTTLAKKDVIIASAKVISGDRKPGDVTVVDKDIVVFCGQDALLIKELKPAGKKTMSAEAFLAGYKI